MENDNDRAVFAGANKVMSLVNRMQQMKQYAADQARKAEEQELLKKKTQQPDVSSNTDTRGLIVSGLGLLARFVGQEIDRTAQNAQEQQAKQQMQVNQAKTEQVVDINGADQQVTGTSIASPTQEQVSNAIGFRKNRSLDLNMVQEMIPAKGTQLEADRDKVMFKFMKGVQAPLGDAPSTEKTDKSYSRAAEYLEKTWNDRETKYGNNPLRQRFYDIFVAPGRNTNINQAIALYQQANQQYQNEAQLYEEKLKYNEGMLKQYTAGKSAYFENAMHNTQLARDDAPSAPAGYTAQAVGARFNQMSQKRWEEAHKRGDELYKKFADGLAIGQEGAKNLAAQLVNDGDNGTILLSDMGNLLGQLVEHDDNFDSATHQLVDNLAGQGFNKAAQDVMKIVANNDTLKQRLYAVNEANRAGVGGKGEWRFWKASFTPQMISDVCKALEEFDGYKSLEAMYTRSLAQEQQSKTVQFVEANDYVASTLGYQERAEFKSSLNNNIVIVDKQVDQRTEKCKKIIDDPRSTPEEKYYAYVSMTGSPERVPDEITADMLMTAPLREMALPFNQMVAKEALVKTQNMLLPMLSNSSIQNASESVLSDLLMKLVDADASFRQQAMTSFKVDSVAKISSAINGLKDSELQERVFQLKHSREFKQAVMNLMRNAVQTATITDSAGRVVNTNGNTGLAIVDNYVRKMLEQEMLQSRINNIPLEPASFTAALKARINRQMSNNIFYSVIKFDQSKIDKMVEQHWDSTSAKITAAMQQAQNNAVAGAIAAKQK
jgi:hypothetical protein